MEPLAQILYGSSTTIFVHIVDRRASRTLRSLLHLNNLQLIKFRHLLNRFIGTDTPTKEYILFGPFVSQCCSATTVPTQWFFRFSGSMSRASFSSQHNFQSRSADSFLILIFFLSAFGVKHYVRSFRIRFISLSGVRWARANFYRSLAAINRFTRNQ